MIDTRNKSFSYYHQSAICTGRHLATRRRDGAFDCVRFGGICKLSKCEKHSEELLRNREIPLHPAP
jgi:hypothetical protein